MSSVKSVDSGILTSFREVPRCISKKVKNVWRRFLQGVAASNIILTSVKGIDKVLQLVGGALIIPQVLFKDSTSPSIVAPMGVVLKLSDDIRQVKSAIGARRFTDDLKAITDKKGSIGTGLSLVGNIAETLMWLKKYNLIALDRASHLVGQLPVMGKALSKVSLLMLKNVFQTGGMVFSIASTVKAIDNPDVGDKVPHWLALAGCIAKIGLIWFSACWCSVPFALLVLFAGTVGLTRMLYVQKDQIRTMAGPSI